MFSFKKKNDSKFRNFPVNSDLDIRDEDLTDVSGDLIRNIIKKLDVGEDLNIDEKLNNKISVDHENNSILIRGLKVIYLDLSDTETNYGIFISGTKIKYLIMNDTEYKSVIMESSVVNELTAINCNINSFFRIQHCLIKKLMVEIKAKRFIEFLNSMFWTFDVSRSMADEITFSNNLVIDRYISDSVNCIDRYNFMNNFVVNLECYNIERYTDEFEYGISFYNSTIKNRYLFKNNIYYGSISYGSVLTRDYWDDEKSWPSHSNSIKKKNENFMETLKDIKFEDTTSAILRYKDIMTRFDNEELSCIGDLYLDGFEYEALIGNSPLKFKKRIKWLKSQPEHFIIGSYIKPQPWKRLIYVLRKVGYDHDADQVGIRLKRLLLKNSNLSDKIIGQAFDLLSHFGYSFIRPIFWFVLIWIFSSWLFNNGMSIIIWGHQLPSLWLRTRLVSAISLLKMLSRSMLTYTRLIC